MSPEQEKKQKNWLIWLLVGGCVASILFSFYTYFYKKNYNFIVEVPCDNSTETCFERDCSNLDDCPPNGLSDFKRYSLKASDFKYCKDENCAQACAEGTIKCESVQCEENSETGESCVYPEPSTSTQ